MDPIQSLLENWVNRQGAASLWLGITAVLFFGVAWGRSGKGRPPSWLPRLLEASARSLGFVAIVGLSSFLLNSDNGYFNRIYASFTTQGSLSNQAWQAQRDNYGGIYVQRDLQVMQYVPVIRQETVQPDPTRQPLYRNVTAEEPISQNSITAFHGDVAIHLVDPGQRSDNFSCYEIAASYRYTLTNPTGAETRLEFQFPLSAEAKFYQNVSVSVDGKEVPSLHLRDGVLAWEDRLAARATSVLLIRYETRGMDDFRFEIPQGREVANFNLTFMLNTDDFGIRTEPDNGAIQVERTTTSPSQASVTWKIERSILAPILGINFPQHWPYAPTSDLVMMLPYAAQALVLFLCLAVLTLVICATPVHLKQIALLACLFALPYVFLMAGVLPIPPATTPAQFAALQVKMLPVFSSLPLILAFLVLRKTNRLPLVLVLILMAFFMGGYSPWVALQLYDQKRHAVEGLIQAGMIAYLFLLTLFTRLRAMPPLEPRQAGSGGNSFGRKNVE